MSHQIHWSYWWKLWPRHSASYDEDFDIYFNIRSFSIFQWSYWDNKGTRAERSYRRGYKFAEQKVYEMGQSDGIEYFWDCPRDYDNPFDRGIIDYAKKL